MKSILFLFLVFVLASTVVAKTWKKNDCAICTADSLNVRSSACGPVVGSIRNGNKVNVSKTIGTKTCLGGTYNWVKITYNNNRNSGYVADSYLDHTSCDTSVSVGNHHINQAGLNLIEISEGWSSCYYKDVAGYPTIGYGHLITSKDPYKPGDCISKATGEKLLVGDVSSAESCVNKYVTVPLNDNQFSALVDFTYNLGCGAFKGSTLLKELNQGNYGDVCNQLKRWNKAGGKVQPGLVTRRQRECDLWSS